MSSGFNEFFLKGLLFEKDYLHSGTVKWQREPLIAVQN